MSSSPNRQRLTEALLHLPGTSESYERATKHPFLKYAGECKISKESLERWLTQDRFYALIGYSTFLGNLIAKIPSPICSHLSKQSKIHRNRLTILAGAMANIDREVGFFENVAEQNGLNLSAQPIANSSHPKASETRVKDGEDDETIVDLNLLNKTTRAYIHYMIYIASSRTFEEGLILLYAMEKMYLDSWTFASTFFSKLNFSKEELQEPGLPRALSELIDNWSSKEFQKFVDDIGGLVDDLNIEIDSEMGKKLQAVWLQILSFEEDFWQAGEPFE